MSSVASALPILGELGIAGIEGGVASTQATMNSAVFNPALSYNSTGYKDVLTPSSSINPFFLIILTILIIIILYFVMR